MAVYISSSLDGLDILKNEGLPIRTDGFKLGLKNIGIINLMPKKSETESQILRILSLGKEDINVEFIRLESYVSSSNDYVVDNYVTFNDVKEKLHGVIITGAPLEKLEFEDVSYIDELKEILDYVKANMKSSLYICWGAQVALNHFYSVRKQLKDSKIFGVFSHEIVNHDNILQGINNGFKAPHSRHTCLNKYDLEKSEELELICITNEGEEHIIKGNFNDYYVLGHCEYDETTLSEEYFRDLNKGLSIDVPKNYFKNDDSNLEINFNWREDGIKIYSNWISQISF